MQISGNIALMLPIHHYRALAPEPSMVIFALIDTEFRLARAMILSLNEQDELLEALLVTVNGIARGIQNTGWTIKRHETADRQQELFILVIAGLDSIEGQRHWFCHWSATVRSWERFLEFFEFSPTGKVPVLQHNGRSIWESLAILEYLAEQFPEANLWPDEVNRRTEARCISHEMHAGFAALRTSCPMNMRRQPAGIAVSASVKKDADTLLLNG